jgi:hypothetical protein
MENIENKQKKTLKQKVWGFAKPVLIATGFVTVGILYGGNKYGIKTRIDGAAARVKGGCKNAYKNLTTRKSTECAGGQCDSAPQQPQYNNNQPRQKWNNNGGGKFNNKA